jgi:hypothetical protein
VRHVENSTDIDGHDVLPILQDGFRFGGKSVAPVDARIVHQNRYLTDSFGDAGSNSEARISIGNVQPEAPGRAPSAVDQLLGLHRCFFVHIKDDDACRFFGVSEGNRSSDAGTTTGDRS